MLAYARLQCKNEFYVSRDYTSAPKEVLFEFRGKPHHIPDTDEFKCYFAMAQPYPSRNTAMYVYLLIWLRASGVLTRSARGLQAEHVLGTEDGK